MAGSTPRSDRYVMTNTPDECRDIRVGQERPREGSARSCIDLHSLLLLNERLNVAVLQQGSAPAVLGVH